MCDIEYAEDGTVSCRYEGAALVCVARRVGDAMKPLIPYIRQSRKKEQTISLSDQRAAIQNWAKHAHVELAPEVVEQGVSGSKPWRERELGAAITTVESGEAAGIIVAYQSRLSRESGLGTAEVWNALEAAGARLVCLAENIDTARDDDQEFNFGIQALIARQEWKRHRKNWAGANDKCARGGVYQGPLPPGYDKGRQKALPNTEGILPEIETKQLSKNADAVAVRACFELKAAGGSYAECRRVLEGAGVKTATGLTTWGVTSIRSMLRNPIYKGVLSNGHERVFPEYAIVSPRTWQEAHSVTLPDSPARTGRQDAGDWAILGGLVKCAGCDHRMTPNSDKRKLAGGGFKEHRIYVCKGQSGCKMKARANAGELESLVIEAAYSYFAEAVKQMGGAGVGKDTDTDKLTALAVEADDARRRMSAFVAMVDPDDPGAKERIDALRATVQATEAAEADERAATRVIVSPEEMRAAFEAADLTGKRGLVRNMLNGITVTGGNRDGEIADRVELDYRVLVWG